jgi:hypothetical protein
MPAVTFDTLKFVETLKEAGVPETQAKAFSTAVQGSHEAADLATKGDIADLRHEMKEIETGLRHEIGDLRKDMDAKFEASTISHRQEMSDLKFELLKWIIGIAIAQAGLLIGLLKFLP